MKRSIELTSGIWQFEWLEDKIAVSKWDQAPMSTDQWVVVSTKGYLEGNSNEDICFIPIEN